jgi:Mlc titration factor MtfA (ptsG expression regulator)
MFPLYSKLMILLIILTGSGVMIYFIFMKKTQKNKRLLAQPFPESWRSILNEHIKFYCDLEDAQKAGFEGHKESIIGMVGNRFMNGTMIISKPDLINAYDRTNHKNNVGIHEFIHLIDNVDGATDGIPEILIKHAYVAPWLHIIKEEMSHIEQARSDISPYALTSNAEF